MLGLVESSREWAVTVAPPADFAPFVMAGVEYLRGRLRETGALPVRLDAQLGVLLTAPEGWTTPRVIEWGVIALTEATLNVKGNVYSGRPLDVLKAFVRMVAKEQDRRAMVK
jgi:hypothetical protein